MIESEACLLILWKHECMRVFSDRFTTMADRDWFVNLLMDLIEQQLGPEYKQHILTSDPVFVDFMRYTSKATVDK